MNKMLMPLAALGLTAALAGFAAQTAHAAPTAELLGDAVPPDQATRTIELMPTTRWVNVTHGEVIRFVANGREFAFNFDGAGTRAFDLKQVAPAGMLDHGVEVYIAADPNLVK